jgi:hypothetical protein
VFHAAETDLAVRALAAAARGLQQLERPEDGVKLLEDYLADHIGTPYGASLQAEIVKLDPARKQGLAVPANKDAGEQKAADPDAAEPTSPAPAGDAPAPVTKPE